MSDVTSETTVEEQPLRRDRARVRAAAATTTVYPSLVRWDDPTVAAMRREQQSELAMRYGVPAPCGDIDAETVVFTLGLFEDDDTLLAVGALRHGPEHDKRTGELSRIYVAPGARGRGLGRVLLKEIEERAAVLDYRTIVLETGVQQPEAMGLYLSQGYRAIPAYQPYVGDCTSRCFSRTLPDPDVVVDEPHADVVVAVGRGRAATRDSVTVTVVTADHPDLTTLRSTAQGERDARHRSFLDVPTVGEGQFGPEAIPGATVLAAVGGDAVGLAAVAPLRNDLRAEPPVDASHVRHSLEVLYVRAWARRNGIGGRLIDEAEHLVTAAGGWQLVARVAAMEAEGISLLLDRGFRPVPPPEGDHADDTSVYLAKHLRG